MIDIALSGRTRHSKIALINYPSLSFLFFTSNSAYKRRGWTESSAERGMRARWISMIVVVAKRPCAKYISIISSPDNGQTSLSNNVGESVRLRGD
jgi:hypothetical protein